MVHSLHYVKLLKFYRRLIFQLICSLLLTSIYLLNYSDKKGFYVTKCSCWKHLGRKNADSPNTMVSSCSKEATFYGSGQKVVSFSFYNDTEDSRYSIGIKPNLELVKELYPGWLIRLYSDVALETGTKYCDLLCSDDKLFWCDVTDIPQLGNISSLTGATWRFIAVGDPLVDIFLSRDLDSRIIHKEVAAVNQWINSNKMIHLMRDSPSHTKPLMAGMWGLKTNNLTTQEAAYLQNLIVQFAHKGTEFMDQDILERVFYNSNYFNKTMAHDSFHCKRFNEALCLHFPTEMQYNPRKFVGQIFWNNYEQKDAMI